MLEAMTSAALMMGGAEQQLRGCVLQKAESHGRDGSAGRAAEEGMGSRKVMTCS